MKKAIRIICHILGYPLLIALVLWATWPVMKNGGSYGIMAFVGLIVALVVTLVYYIAYICLVANKKKSKTSQTLTLVLVVFFSLCGLWIIADAALPDVLADAASHTIFYEDLVDNYQARADVNKMLLDEYIERNYLVGNLPDKPARLPGEKAKLTDDEKKTLANYQKKGMRDKSVKELLTIQFASIDKNGYVTFVAPYIDMANGGRLTIPTLVHLLTDERTYEHVDYALYDKAAKEIKKDPVMWNILDMMGKPMDMELALLEEIPILSVAIPLLNPYVMTATEKILGSPISLSVNGKTLSLIPSNEARGVLDYQSMAWLNSNGAVYGITGLMATRNLFLIFAFWIILLTFIEGAARGTGEEQRRPNTADYTPDGQRISRVASGTFSYEPPYARIIRAGNSSEKKAPPEKKAPRTRKKSDGKSAGKPKK